jgi:hypothetical protein
MEATKELELSSGQGTMALKNQVIDVDDIIQKEEDEQPNPLHALAAPKRSSILNSSSSSSSGGGGEKRRSRRGSKSNRGTLKHRRSIHTLSQSVTEKWDPFVFLIIWLSWILLPISVGLHFSRLCGKRYSRAKSGALWGQGHTSRIKRERNLCLVVECIGFGLIITNLFVYTFRYPNIDLSVEVFLPPAMYFLITGIHAADQALISRKDEALPLAHFVYRRSLLQTLWVKPLRLDAAKTGSGSGKHSPMVQEVDAPENEISSDLQQKLLLSKYSKQAQRRVVTQDLDLWCKSEQLDQLHMNTDTVGPSMQLSLSKKSEYHLGFIPSGSQFFTADDLSKEIWGMALGLKRWDTFRIVTFSLALVHGLLPVIYRVIFHYAYDKSSGDGTGAEPSYHGQHSSSVDGQLYWERTKGGAQSDVYIATWIGTTSALLGFSFMLLVAR